MNRRTFFAVVAIFLANLAQAANRRFSFKIKTDAGSIIGNILIEAKDIDAAKYKLQKRYPKCIILSSQEK